MAPEFARPDDHPGRGSMARFRRREFSRRGRHRIRHGHGSADRHEHHPGQRHPPRSHANQRRARAVPGNGHPPRPAHRDLRAGRIHRRRRSPAVASRRPASRRSRRGRGEDSFQLHQLRDHAHRRQTDGDRSGETSRAGAALVDRRVERDQRPSVGRSGRRGDAGAARRRDTHASPHR